MDSNKNIVDFIEAVTTTPQNTVLAEAQDSATLAVTKDVERGCTIKAIWLSFDVCGLAGAGAIQRTNIYLIKNPGSNLTAPGVFVAGSSNEKKFIFKMWAFMTMRNQDGNPPYHFEGWIKIPKQYQRFGANDLLHLTFANDTLTGHFSGQCIYKWYK